MSYRLTLTAEDLDTIAFVGGRYAWADALSSLEEGENVIPEHEAWSIAEAFDADTECGHSMFPMLDEWSELYVKLCTLRDAIV